MITFSASRKKRLTLALMAMVAVYPLMGCDLTQNQLKMDRSANLEFQDYRDSMSARELPVDPAAADNSDIPALQPYVAGVSDQLKAMPLVSISVNQTIPLRDALFELAKQADYDLELDPRITGSIIFTARNRPFDLVIDRIASIAGLRYKFEDDILRVEMDTPYSKTYKIDYLSFVRKNTGNISTNVGVASGESAVTSNSGSSFSITSEFESNFWGELETNLKQILDSNAAGNNMKTTSDPAISVASANPQAPVLPLPVPPVDESALSDGAVAPAPTAAPADVAPQAGDEHSSVINSNRSFGQEAPADPAAAPVDMSTNPQAPVVQPPSSVLQVNSLPADAAVDGAAAGGAAPAGAQSSMAINKQAGIITVFANERVQKQIEQYLDAVRKSTSSQVLIEARVLEVSLSDEFAAGINWQNLEDAVRGFGINFNAGLPALDPASTNSIQLGWVGNNGDLGVVAQALSRFGTVHALASPRVTVLNNQSAVLSVAENQVYFDLDFEREDGEDGEPDTINVESEIRNVPEGVLINVLPSIDLDRQQISMQIRPTVTRITRFVNDPAAAIIVAGNPALAGVTSQIPVLNVQEIDSVVKMDSGKVIVMGGLIQDRAESVQEGVPVLSEAPLIGGLFRSQGDSIEKTELVIFLRATILTSTSDTVHNTDREMYKLFSQDRRPVKM